MHKVLLSVVGVISLIISSVVFAQDYLPPIDDPNFRPYPIAVPDFKDLATNGEQAAKDGTDVLRSDISIASAFKVLDPRSYLVDPKQEGISAATINFTNWINVGAEGLIKVGIAKSGNELMLEGYLFDVATQRELLHKKIHGTSSELRALVHKFADMVVKRLTGVRGVFFTRILFTKKIGYEKAICMMDFDGYNEQCLVKNGSINLLPSWNADGQSFFYSSYITGGPHVYCYDLKTRKTRVVSRYKGLNVGGAVSPDGKALAVSLSRDDNSEIYRLELDGSDLVRLTRHWAIDSSPCWSPDGTRIAFVSERAGNPHIYTMKADGSEVTRLTFQGNYNQSPDWSPRGDWILFNARDERIVYDIFKINPGTGEIRRLTQDQGNNEDPSFSPDGNLVVFSSTRTGESKLYIMNANGTNQRLISRQRGEYTTPVWSPWIAEKKQ